ncbi:DUF1501 domain-containing protein [Colwellia echini]|uniref:DUF1501 domain-containing protein n=2 Tax=Colwellia echini TaxID=1982103 RepID=A0ABY3MWD9_9GAMM|nr:DUF1501 domain-containing protein [Colwellia echini]
MKNIKHKTDNQISSELSRRKFIKAAGASLALLTFPGLATSLSVKNSAVNSPKSPKIVWVLLRGALDSLHTVVPTFDTQYQVLRPHLSTSFNKPLLPLDNGFALHPSLVNLHQWYQQKQLTPVVAVSSGYSRRSHFDGQDYLESGAGSIDYNTGWLARAIDVKNKRALAVSRSIPISLRSSEHVFTWYPTKLKSADDDIYQSLINLYQDDESLKTNLISGLEVMGVIGKEAVMQKDKMKQGKFVELSQSCAKLMIKEEGVDCAMLELGGWDTHNNQAKRLEKNLTELDDGLAALKTGLGGEWQNTIVIVGTEFGRTAKENGTGGTDHGTASALFLAGGALSPEKETSKGNVANTSSSKEVLIGGKIAGKWPGLTDTELFEQRDLMPTTNSFSWIAKVLTQHWGFTDAELLQVFPQLKQIS